MIVSHSILVSTDKYLPIIQLLPFDIQQLLRQVISDQLFNNINRLKRQFPNLAGIAHKL